MMPQKYYKIQKHKYSKASHYICIRYMFSIFKILIYSIFILFVVFQNSSSSKLFLYTLIMISYLFFLRNVNFVHISTFFFKPVLNKIINATKKFCYYSVSRVFPLAFDLADGVRARQTQAFDTLIL